MDKKKSLNLPISKYIEKNTPSGVFFLLKWTPLNAVFYALDTIYGSKSLCN